jgi:HJR/Mrr/RecB family endonuclease
LIILYENMPEILTLNIKADSTLSEEDVNIRYTLIDTIEQRKIGQVVEEGSGKNSIYIAIRGTSAKRVKNKVKPILLSLGLLKATKFDTIVL